MSAAIKHLDVDAPVDVVEKILLQDGVVIIDKVVSASIADTMLSEVEPWLSRGTLAKGEWLGTKTRRVHHLLNKSRTICENVANPHLLPIVDRILLPWCDKYQLSSCSITSIGPKESPQELHRDTLIYPIANPTERVAHLTTFWALTDFTDENGATRVVPGSHRWGDDYIPTQSETVPAEMEKGSVVMFLGSIFHGGGANTTQTEWRHALYMAYNLGWLKQEEAHFLVNPPEVAQAFPRRVQQLVGYQMHSPWLGWYDLQDPIRMLEGYEELSEAKEDDRPERKDGRVDIADGVRRL